MSTQSRFFPSFVDPATLVVREPVQLSQEVKFLSTFWQDQDNSGTLSGDERFQLLVSDLNTYNRLPGGSRVDDEPEDFIPATLSEPPPPFLNPNAVTDATPCLSFDPVQIGDIIPRFKLPFQPCPPSAPGFTGGRPNVPPSGPDTAYADRNDPRVQTTTGSSRSVVNVPTQPQHVSQDIARVAPNVEQNILEKFGQETLNILVNTPLSHVQGWANSLFAKAMASGNANVGQFAGDVAAHASSGEYEKKMREGLGVNVTQMAQMTPLRQVVNGVHDPNAGPPDLVLFSDAAHFANFAGNNALKGSEWFLNNALNVTKDLYGLTTGQCIGKDANLSFAEAARLRLQGLNVNALGRMLDGAIKHFVIKPLQAAGPALSNAFWNYLCSLDGTPPSLPATSADALGELRAMRDGGSTGARPGNLLFAGMGDETAVMDASFFSDLPEKIAARAGAQGVANLIRQAVNDPSAQADSIVSVLPALFMSGEPKVARLLELTNVFAGVCLYISKLSNPQVALLENRVTQLGSPFVDFVVDVKGRVGTERTPGEFGPIAKLGQNLVTNKLTFAQKDALAALARQWEGLEVDRLSVTEPMLLAHVEAILDPRDENLREGESLGDLIDESNTFLRNGMGGPAGNETAFGAAAATALMRVGLLTTQTDISEADLTKRVKDMMAVTQEHVEALSFPGPMGDFVASLAAADDIGSMVDTGIGSCVAMTQETVQEQQLSVAACNQIMAEQRGVNAFDIHEQANEINHVSENNDTQSYLAGALQQHADALKSNLTESLPSVSGVAKAFEKSELVPGVAEREAIVSALVREMTNAVASTSVNKVSGVRLNQSYEGAVNLTKFTLNRAGTAIANEAPYVRTAGRLVVNQARHMLTEADVVDLRAQFMTQVVNGAYLLGVGDFMLSSKGNSTQAAKKMNIFGQEGTVIADGEEVIIDIPSAEVQIQVNKQGEILAVASSRIAMRVGNKSIVMTGSRIDMNPSAAPTINRREIKTQFVDVGEASTKPEIKPAALPNDGARNPVPCAAPYLDPSDATY